MSQTHRNRIKSIVKVGAGVALGLGIVLVALSDNIDLFYTTSQILTAQPAPEKKVRLGGMVVQDSIVYHEKMNVTFTLTDYETMVPVQYTGILPDLFKEGQGIVTEGTLSENNIFNAQRVLAKHDENYMPAELKKGMEK